MREWLLAAALVCFSVAVIVPLTGGATGRFRFDAAGAALLTAALLFG